MSLHTESIPATPLDYAPARLPPARPAVPTSAWLFQISLALAAVCVGYAIHIRDGEYWPEAIRWVGWAVVLCAAGVALPRVRSFPWSGGGGVGGGFSAGARPVSPAPGGF